MQFAEQFSNFEIVSPSATHLSWAQIVEVLPLKTQDVKLYYLNEASRGVIGRDKMRAMINRKAYDAVRLPTRKLPTQHVCRKVLSKTHICSG